MAKGDGNDDLPPHMRVVNGGKSSTLEERQAARIALQQREAQITQALQLRQAGMTLAKITEECGFSNIKQTQRVLDNLLKESRAADVDGLRDLENARLDRAQASIWPQVLQGNHQAIDRFLRISERRAKLNGLDAPQQLQVTPGSEPIQVWVSRVLALESQQSDIVEADVTDWGEGSG